ncbi:hypothetical protein L226DRAFT_58843 [Lentinus tigrinus ALCF2SS1-7]|uniref:Uncharacterized protein n=1 Tax=Lentinus tigrinus ALCF2SS1-6 TaxID=1328759 RepID=A0A5C2SBM9_9APHY|nr:hypothetical protein L227DRAFT_78551 [Lentinus tigrinus ALCF2SS1-6]RPD75253.1 hypothetical protein L226DRAFT_58843 [Lentinus tigrinus ALCF2SS1-7]
MLWYNMGASLYSTPLTALCAIPLPSPHLSSSPRSSIATCGTFANASPMRPREVLARFRHALAVHVRGAQNACHQVARPPSASGSAPEAAPAHQSHEMPSRLLVRKLMPPSRLLPPSEFAVGARVAARDFGIG